MLTEYTIHMEVENIEPRRRYSLKEVHDLRLIPWAKHYQTLRRIIGAKNLEAERKGKGRLTRYEVKGSDIIKYLKQGVPFTGRQTKP